jgi:hypothetical protein
MRQCPICCLTYGAKAPDSQNYPFNSQLKLTAIDNFNFTAVLIYCRWLQPCFLFIAVGFSQRIEVMI